MLEKDRCRIPSLLSDSQSLDGIAIPDLKIAIIDGTAHIVDPKYPAVIDKIPHFDEFK